MTKYIYFLNIKFNKVPNNIKSKAVLVHDIKAYRGWRYSSAHS